MENEDEQSITKTDSYVDISSSIEAAKSLKVKSLYKFHTYVDALDQYNVWRVGKIMDIEGDDAIITFDGWAPKWNEVSCIQLNSMQGCQTQLK